MIRSIGMTASALMIAAATSPAWAAVVTGDSSTWEGQYHYSDGLPSANGFTAAGSTIAGASANYPTGWGNTLQADGLLLDNSLADGLSGQWKTAAGAFDFTAGATAEISAKVTGGGTFSAIFRIGDADEAYYFALRPELVRGLSGGSGVPFDTTDAFHTYRLAISGSAVSVYIDGSTTATYTDTTFASTAVNFLDFGDITGNASSNWVVESVRWTSEGAFAPIPEPASIALAGLAGTLLIVRRRASRREA